jgi:hypothetical protein
MNLGAIQKRPALDFPQQILCEDRTPLIVGQTYSQALETVAVNNNICLIRRLLNIFYHIPVIYAMTTPMERGR